MIALSLARRTSAVLIPRISLLSITADPSSCCKSFSTHSLQNASFTGNGCSDGGLRMPFDFQYRNHECSMSLTASFCSAPAAFTDSVKEVYDKIIDSIKVKKSAPPNAWLWSLIGKCKNEGDIKLLFNVLEQLRIFRLSNLRIHDNFNSSLCQEVTKACLRVGAVDYGMKTLWAHNVYGLTPVVGSANLILSYAKAQKDIKLMEDIMSLLKKNEISLQPSTADIVFSICYDADNWKLISKYAKRFVHAGVKLRKTAFDTWMEFASKRGDLESLWKIEKLRSDLYKQHTIRSAFSCAKGFLLERKPDSAASVIQVVSQSFPDSKRPDIIDELQNLASEWPSQVIKHQKLKGQKVLIASLKTDIPAMLESLSNLGVKSNVNLDNLNIAEPLTS